MVEVSALKDAYLVAGLSEDEIAQIAAIASIRTFSSSRGLTRSGDAADELFVILSGTVVVTTDDGDRLGEIGINSVVGEMGLLDGRPSAANVTSVGAVSAAAIPIPELRRLMNQNRNWGFLILCNIGRVLSDRLRKSNAKIDELSDLAEAPWQHSLG